MNTATWKYGIERIKAAITCREVLERAGVKIRGNRFVCEWRGGDGLSGSIFADGRLWTDHAGNDKGSVIDLYARIHNRDDKTAIRELGAIAGLGRPGIGEKPRIRPQVKPQTASEAESIPEPPPMDKGRYSEILELQRQRNLPYNAGLQLLIEWGLPLARPRSIVHVNHKTTRTTP